MKNSDNDNPEIDADFGSVLAAARESKNYSVEDVCQQLKIPVHSITAIENNDLDALPGPAFTQGYIRTYAKFLEISEDSVLELYNRAAPREDIKKLKPRSNLPGEASSQSPLVKFVTLLLVIAGIVTVVYGSYQYYQKKADVMETELESKERSYTGSSLDFPASRIDDSEQDAETMASETSDAQAEPEIDVELTEDSSMDTSAADEEVIEQAFAAETGVAVATDEEERMTEDSIQQDVLEIYAIQGSWVEVKDARNKRLFYNMIPVRGSKKLLGKAPFRVTMGNASTTSVTINQLEVDLTDVIRKKNTAVFSVSSDDQNVILR